MDFGKLLLIFEEEFSDGPFQEGLRQPFGTFLHHLCQGVDGSVDLFPNSLGSFLEEFVDVL
eukprot:CAMPEP_0114691254 /NCGR_PEP_ID=MMETSP0191-20121206/66629_1 /TAXON_ID=126664 /ORGANISM="Sorites sp." /LENGTH=60 /DNA_ID=CAMNT_0001982223 /DNA_START=95 /DNA_END=273 /DNA_ORIENTATION=-